MSTPEWAEEQLKVIRSLMERSSVYRALSAPTALFAGAMTVFISVWFFMASPEVRTAEPTRANALRYLGMWWTVLALVGLFSGGLLAARNLRLGAPLMSRGMRTALLDFLPALLCGGAAGFALAWHVAPLIYQSVCWCLFYGLALLATRNYAPRSLVALGWAFTLAGVAFLAAAPALLGLNMPNVKLACLAMASTFGLFHLVYAVVTWTACRRERREQEAAA